MKKTFPIVKNFKFFSLISAVLISAGLVGLILMPFGVNLFNLDIDFIGGTTMHIELNKDVTSEDISKITTVVEDVIGEKISPVQKIGDGTEVLITSKDIPSETRTKVINSIKTEFNLADTDILSTDNVSPKVGSDLQKAAITAAVVASLLMLIYITFRFELTSGLSAIICLAHDILVILSLYVIFKLPLNLNFIAVALTILGYSINAGIIVFDRVRENVKIDKRADFADVVEKSLWQTMGRTINTTITTLLPILMIYILGVPSLKSFTLPLMVGIIAGAYSSIFLSGSLWVFLKKHLAKKT